MSKFNTLIQALSETTDNPEEFRTIVEKEIAQRIQQRRSRLEEVLKQAENSIRVYVLDGNDIHLRRSGDTWTAEHYGLDLSAEGKSIDEALERIQEKSVEYVASLRERSRDALGPHQMHHYEFIETYGSPPKWEQGFRPALNAKLSPFWKFLKFQQPELALAAKTFDVDELREYYNDNFITLTLTRVHVAIETDEDHIILRFLGEDLNGAEVTIYRLDSETENEQWITCKIKGKDVRFALSAIGLTTRQLNQVAFRLKIGDRQVEGRL